MCRDRSFILFQALKDSNSVDLDDKNIVARIRSGFKIMKEEGVISIYDTSKGDYYKELTEYEYGLFFEHGWINAVRMLTLNRYKKRLDKIEVLYKKEINSRNNARFLDYLKTTKKETLNKYYKITQKLNHVGKK